MRKVNYTRHIGLLITEEMFQQISKITDKREILISQYVREVLKDRLSKDARGH